MKRYIITLVTVMAFICTGTVSAQRHHDRHHDRIEMRHHDRHHHAPVAVAPHHRHHHHHHAPVVVAPHHRHVGLIYLMINSDKFLGI